MSKHKCLFCNSKKCHYRVVTTDDNGASYDEVACDKHILDLEKHSDETVPGSMRLFMSSSDRLERHAPIKHSIEQMEQIRKRRNDEVSENGE